MKHVVHHGLGFDTARKVADAAFASYQERFSQYQPEARWTNEKHADITFKVKGVSLAVSYTHLRAHETVLDLVCRLLLDKKKKNNK